MRLVRYVKSRIELRRKLHGRIRVMLSGLDLSFDGWSLAAGFIFGVIGLWMFREGRRQDNDYTPWIGVALMIYPYFVDGAKLNWGLGIVLCFLAYRLW
ncbi:MAG: hypothetical protein COT73_01020 [Bdellovibrio sp. CG10_big_fil_rev_8_21_14_0_10_47_8]|nr:MAG: hypothetical protein COT73_01020 [Bdellovibrio sp. CG10_big_fil_rev_8_21_14_0_10_47_8]